MSKIVPGIRAIVFNLTEDKMYNGEEVFVEDYHSVAENDNQSIFCCAGNFDSGWELFYGKNLLPLTDEDDHVIESYTTKLRSF